MKLEWRLLLAGHVVGLTLLLVAWVQASGELRPKGQVGSLNLGVAGAAVAVASGVRVVTRARQAVEMRQRSVLGGLRPSRRAQSSNVIDLRSKPATATDDVFVSSVSMTRYHRADCLLVAGKTVARASRRSHEADGRRHCGVCAP